MTSKIDFSLINREAAKRLSQLVPQWLPNGKRQQQEWIARNPNRDDKHLGSFSINLRTGAWADFASDDKGSDPISLYAYIKGLSQLEAAKILASILGIECTDNTTLPVQTQPPKANPDDWTPILPVPSFAPPAPNIHPIRGKPETINRYDSKEGDLLGYVCRFITSDGGKDDIPLTFCENTITKVKTWRWKSFPIPRPLYNLPALTQKPDATVLIVEGEKCANVANLLLPEYAVISWSGGCNAVDKSNWRVLAGRKVIIWPDADSKREKLTKAEKIAGIKQEDKPYLKAELQAGMKAAMTIATILHGLNVSTQILHLPETGTLPDGWDIADAVQKENWTVEQVRQYIAANMHPHSNAKPSLTLPIEGEYLFGRYDLKALINHFYLIYNTDTCWDGINKQQMRLSNLRHLVGRDLYKEWTEHPAREVKKELVFEPNGDVVPDCINIFDGFEISPSHTGVKGCERIINHLLMLCGNRTEEFRWLMNWIAYPLKHLGAKMDTSVIMYGSEGPGKSIIWEKIVSKIYGKYAITIGQQQLESAFTGWQSQKLFALCEEVVSRAEKSHYKGMIKHMVTGKHVQINEKNMPLRSETNHINFVFLSNSTVPLELDMGDRRFFVLYCGEVPDQVYFDELFQEINNGGIEAFYGYLMSLDFGEFTPHTKPPLNQEKQNLIEVSLPSPVLFYQEWSQGLLNIPFVSCCRNDLFEEFKRWCLGKNEFAKRERDFVSELRRYLREDRKDITMSGHVADRKTTRIWITPKDREHEGTKEYIEILEKSCRQFRDVIRHREQGYNHAA